MLNHIFQVLTDLINHHIVNLNNALFLHISKSNHNLDFNSAKMLIYIHNKSLRRIFEAAAILLIYSLNTRPGFYVLHLIISRLFCTDYLYC